MSQSISLTKSEQAYAAWIARLIEENGAGDAFSDAIESGDDETVTQIIASFADLIQHKTEQMQTTLLTSSDARQKFTALMWNQLNDMTA